MHLNVIEAANGPRRHALMVGDNLEIMRELRSSGVRFRLILADPPYGTMNRRQGYDESNWADNFEPRLSAMVALMDTDALIAIHISDDHVHHVRILLDQLLGHRAHVATLVWRRLGIRINNAPAFSLCHEYIVVYKKGSPTVNREPRPADDGQTPHKNPDRDVNGPWRTRPMISNGPGCYYPIYGPHGQLAMPPKGKGWSLKESTYKTRLMAGRVWWGLDGKNQRPQLKRYIHEDAVKDFVPHTIIDGADVGWSMTGSAHLKNIGGPHFGSAKPVGLIRYLLERLSQPGDLILDPYGGSATLAEAAAVINSASPGQLARRTVLLQRWEDSVLKHVGHVTRSCIVDAARTRLRHMRCAYGDGYTVLATDRKPCYSQLAKPPTP